jgi:YfiH family protein
MGGNSQSPFGGFNMGHHVGDNESNYISNRASLLVYEGLDDIQWLDQIHATTVVHAVSGQKNLTADACYTAKQGLACAVLTADCLPVLLCSDDGKEVAAAHAGWRGLSKGVLTNSVANFQAVPSSLHVCFGPCIGPCQFEVGEEVFDTFTKAEAFAGCKLEVEQAFSARGEKYYADLKGLAIMQLKSLGIELITANSYCTCSDEENFFSYRREPRTGRMASFIYRR